jgi:hypothetical protein
VVFDDNIEVADLAEVAGGSSRHLHASTLSYTLMYVCGHVHFSRWFFMTTPHYFMGFDDHTE